MASSAVTSEPIPSELLEYAMYIFINNDLKMDKGKIASQVGHVVQFVTEDIIRMGYETTKGVPEEYSRYMKWKADGCAKIVLKATQEELDKLKTLPEARHIIDAGRTQIAPNSLTAVGLFPDVKHVLKDITRGFKLL